MTFHPNFAYSSANARPWLALEPVINTVGAFVSADAGETTVNAISDEANMRIACLTAATKRLLLLNSVVMVFVLALIVRRPDAGWIANSSAELANL